MIRRLLSLTDVVAIAHRGGSALRPENTMAAFDHAVALGADGVECDVHLSRDGEPVVIHDPTLDRTTGATGPVSRRTAAELAAIDAAYHFGPSAGFPFRGRGIGVPRLADLLDRHPQLRVIVEIKGDRPDVAERVIAVVSEAGARDRVIIGGFSGAVLDAVRRLAPDLPTGASSDEVAAAIRAASSALPMPDGPYRVFQAPFRFNGQQAFDARFVRGARAAGRPVQVWVVDDPDEMRLLISWGVTGIISDRPDLAINAIEGLRQP